MKVMVETSAHHVHVSEADLETLFGKGAALTNKKDLSQPGQFACEEKVEVVGPKGAMKMSILGPTRPETQVEISLTDARKLGMDDDELQKFMVEKAGVAFGRGEEFGKGGSGFLRLNAACPRSVIKKALDQVRDALAAR